MTKLNKFDHHAMMEQAYDKGNILNLIIQEFINDETYNNDHQQALLFLEDYYSNQIDPEHLERIHEVRKHDLGEIVLKIIGTLTNYAEGITLSNVAGQCAGFFKLHDTYEWKVTSAAEMLGVLAEAGMLTIALGSNGNPHRVYPEYGLNNPQLVARIAKCMYLPPLTVPPKKRYKNNDSAYYYAKQKSLLGNKLKYHDKEIRLDQMDNMSAIPLSINVEFLMQVGDELKAQDFSKKGNKFTPTDKKNQRKYFEVYTNQTFEVCIDIIHQGNEFYVPWAPDVRGRRYSCGYHVNPQGKPWRKAMIDFAEKEIVEGIDKYQDLL